MNKFFINLHARVFRHWQTTAKGILYGVFTLMFYQGKLTDLQYGVAIGTILTFNAIFIQKDPDKVETKPEHKP